MEGQANSIKLENTTAFSVVVPTFDREDSLARTITSILNMRTSELPGLFELLIVDNNPSSPIRNLVESFAQEAGFPIRYIPEPRRGVSRARNTGVKMSNGDYVAFVDDDCTVHPDWLLNLMNAFITKECDIVQGKVLLEFEDLNLPEWVDDSDMANFALFDPGNDVTRPHTIMTGNAGIRKSVFEKYGFFDVRLGPGAAGSAEDLEFFRRIENEGLHILYVPDVVVYHRIIKERLTKEALLDRYYKMGCGIMVSGIDSGNTHVEIIRLVWKILARSVKSFFYGLARSEIKKFKQMKKIALYKGKIRGIRSLARDFKRENFRKDIDT